MKPVHRGVALSLALAAFFASAGVATTAQSDQASVGDLVIRHAWSRATASSAPGAGYMTIINRGAKDDRLLSATSAAAGRVELHSSQVQDGVMRMRPVPDGVPIPRGGEVKLQPGGGYHLMLMQLKSPLTAGTRVPVTLRFDQAGSVTVELRVEPMASAAAHDGHAAP